jgi:hypothetical protein
MSISQSPRPSHHLRVLTHLAEFADEHALPVYYDPRRRRVMVCCDKFVSPKFAGFGVAFRRHFERTYKPKLDVAHHRDYEFVKTVSDTNAAAHDYKLTMTLDALCDFMVFHMARECMQSDAMAQLRNVIQVNTAFSGTVVFA